MLTNHTAAGLIVAMAFLTACSNNDDPSSATNTPEQNSGLDTVAIDAKITELLTDSKIPGLSVALVSTQNDTPVFWSKGYGFANVESQIPADENTAFWMASISKSVLGTLLQMAKEQGLVDLENDIRSDLISGSGFTIDDPLDRAISLRSLATHSSGILDSNAYECSYYVINDDGSVESLVDSEANCDIQGRVRLRDYLAEYLDSDGLYFSANDNFSTSEVPESDYSNVGAALAGHYLELRSGQPLHEYAKSQLFIPLGMTHSGWTSDSLSGTQLATPYFEDDGEVIALPNYELATYPDGGLRSSAKDIATFLSLIMNHGMYDGNRLLQSESITDLTAPSALDDAYGFFFERGRGVVGHSGSDPGARSIMAFKSDSQVGVVLIANSDDIDDGDWSELINFLFDNAEAL